MNKTRLGVPAPTLSPAPPARIELREVVDVREAEAPKIAPQAPLVAPLYEVTESEQTRVALERLQVAREWIEFLKSQMSAETEKSRLGRLHYEWARTLETPLGEDEQALEQYQKAQALVADHEPTVAGLRRLWLRRGDAERALPWFDEQVRLSVKKETKAALLYEKGVLLEQQLKRLAEARKAFEQALELAPLDASIARAVVRARRRDQAWNELDRALESQIQNTQGDEVLRGARLAERARLSEAKRRDGLGAVAFYQSAFEAAPEVSVALADLERLHGVAPRAKELIAVLSERARLASDPRVRAAIWHRQARVFEERLGDARAAAEVLERAFAETRDELGILHDLARLYERTDQPEALLSAWQRLEEKVTERREKIELRVRMGLLYAERLQDESSAIRLLEQARELDPAHAQVSESLTHLYTKRQEWAPLVRLLLGQADASLDAALRADLHSRVAGLQEEKLGDRAEAKREAQRVLGLVPGHPPAFRLLERLLIESSEHGELVELYERAVELSEDDTHAFVWLFKIGRLYEDALGEPGRAVATYQRILERAPRHLEAWSSLERAATRALRFDVLVHALEQQAALYDKPKKLNFLQQASEVASAHGGDEARALGLLRSILDLDARNAVALASLRRLHERAGRYVEVVEIYEKEQALAVDARDKAQIAYSIGRIQELRLGRDEVAVAQYKKALDRDPKHRAASRALISKLTELGRFEELAARLSKEIEVSESDAEKAEWALRLAETYENRLNKLEPALEAYELALSVVAAWRPALEGRRRLLAALGRHETLVAALDLDAESPDASVRLAARLAAAEVLRDDLGLHEAAAERYEQVLVEHPLHVEALIGLDAIYTELGLTEELARVLGEEVRAFHPITDQVAALRELVRLERPWGARGDALEALLERVPQDRQALELLERKTLSDKALERLAMVDARLGEQVEQPLLAAGHRTRLAESIEERNPIQALLGYRRALELDPENLAAARGVSRIAEIVGQSELLLEAAEGEAKITRDTAYAASLFTRAALTLRDKGADAVRPLERALEVHPEDLRAARELHALLIEQQKYDRLVSVLSSAAQRSASAPSRMNHWIAVARAHAEHRADLPAALTALLRVERIEPDQPALLVELGELYVRDRQFDQAVRRLSRALELPLDPETARAVRLRLAELYQAHLDRPDEAGELLRAVLAEQPAHREALRRLLALQMAAGDAGACETARAWARASEGAEQAEAAATWGRLSRDAGRWEEASEAFESAVSLVGVGERGGAADFRQLLLELPSDRRLSGWEAYARALERFLQSGPSAEAGAATALELGRVYLDELGDSARGFPALERGLRARPQDLALRIEYAKRLEQARLHERALGELRQVLQLAPTRVETWRDLTSTFDALGRNAEAHLSRGPLVLLGGGSELDRATWSARVPRPALIPEGSFGDAEFDLLVGAEPREDLIALLAQLGELSSKLFAPGLERFGLSPRERVGARTAHPLRAIVDRVARVFGIEEIEIYPAQEPLSSIHIVLTDPLGLVIPASFSGWSETEQVFLLARSFSTISRGVFWVDALDDAQLADWVLAALRLVDPRAGTSRSSGAEIENLTRRLAKALPWLSKGRFEEAARRAIPSASVDVAAWARELRWGALRAAWILADDVSSCRLLERTRGSVLGLSAEGAAVAQRELLRSWVSEPSFEVRRRVGLL